MKTLQTFSILMMMWLTLGCAGTSKVGRSGLDAQLKVTGANSQLKAKLLLKNISGKEIVLQDLNSRFFVVQTTDAKPMEPKSAAGKSAAPVRIKPGETVETAFSLQDNYAFWDRLTKYKVWYDGPDVKTEAVQVWF